MIIRGKKGHFCLFFPKRKDKNKNRAMNICLEKSTRKG